MSEETLQSQKPSWDEWFNRLSSEGKVAKYGNDVFVNFGEGKIFTSPESVVALLPRDGTPDDKPCPRIGLELPRMASDETETFLNSILRLQITSTPTYETTVLYRRLTRVATVIVGRARESDDVIPMATPEDTRLIGHSHPSYLGRLGERGGVEAAKKFIASEHQTYDARVWGILESQGEYGGLCLAPSPGDLGGLMNRIRNGGASHSEIIVSPFGISRFSLLLEDRQRVQSREDLNSLVAERFNRLQQTFSLSSDDRLPIYAKELQWQIQLFDPEVKDLVLGALPALRGNMVD